MIRVGTHPLYREITQALIDLNDCAQTWAQREILERLCDLAAERERQQRLVASGLTKQWHDATQPAVDALVTAMDSQADGVQG